MRGAFISATDTNIGKTHVGCLLVAHLASQNLDFVIKKPLATGQATPSDTARYQQVLKNHPRAQNITMAHFSSECSTANAAKLQNQTVLCRDVAAFCQTPRADILLVEGAGGLMSPLCQDALNIDLAEQLALPIVLVAPNRLGMINHILLNAALVKSRHMRMAAVIINQIDADTTDYQGELRAHLAADIAILNTQAVDFAANLLAIL